MKWYSDKFRRHLCDMHIEDWNDEFLSEFSPENYCEMLKKAKIQVAMIYLQSHVGYCNWPSKTAKVHRHFEINNNDMQKLISLCRENEIKTVGYYSLNYNTWAHDTHPDWHMQLENGKSERTIDPNCRYGLCCPNNMEYREFVYRQIDEMLAYFTVDGLFFDMLFWPHPCYCPACQKRYMEEKGKKLPKQVSCSPEEWIEFCDSRAYWMGEWAKSVTEYVHRSHPDMPVEHNFSAATGGFDNCCRDGVSEASEYVGGDLYGGPLEQSFVCGVYRDLSKNQPFEYMTNRCTPNLRAHTVTRTEDELTRQIMLTCAHHGAFLAIDAIDPIGTLDERFYELLGRINQKEAAYEQYLTGELVENIGLFYNLDSAVNLQNNSVGSSSFLHFSTTSRVCNNRTACIQAAKHLIGAHIPFGITSKGKKDTWGKYRAIIAPNINRLDEETVDALIQYVAEGGCLYFSNCDEKRLFNTLIGGKLIKYTGSTKPYIFPAPGYEDIMLNYNEKYPLPLDVEIPLIEGVNRDKICAYVKLAYTSVLDEQHRFASIHSDPPGITTEYPGLIETTYGKGKVIWAAGSFEFHEARDYGKILIEIIKRLDNRPFTVSSTAGSNVEIISFIDANRMRISAVDVTDGTEFFTIPDFKVTVMADNPVVSVKKLPYGIDIPFSYDSLSVTFTVSDLRIMDMYEIEFQS